MWVGFKPPAGIIRLRRPAIEFEPPRAGRIKSRAAQILLAVVNVVVLVVLLFVSLTFVFIGLPLLFLVLVIYLAILNARRNRIFRKIREQRRREAQEETGEGPEVTLSQSEYRVLDDEDKVEG